MKTSSVQQRGPVAFPEFTGERVYMLPFTKAAGLPFDLARWQPTVDAMLDGVDVAGPIYLMIDQGMVRAGVTHRRPGVHIDGYWRPGVQAHGQLPPGNPGHGHRPPEPGRGHIFAGSHGTHVAGARPGSWDNGKTPWSHRGQMREAIILASSVQGGAAWVGQYDGEPGEGGDFSHLDLSSMRKVPMAAGHAWAGDTMTMLHASVPLPRDTQRTLVRLNVPGWLP